MIVSQENILSVIPQRPPFVMIDKLLGCDEESSSTTFRVTQDNVLVDNGELTEAGLIENIAQTAAAGVGYLMRQNGGTSVTGYIAAIKNLAIFGLPRVGNVIDTTVTIDKQIFDVTMIHGSITSNGMLLAECEMKIFIKK